MFSVDGKYSYPSITQNSSHSLNCFEKFILDIYANQSQIKLLDQEKISASENVYNIELMNKERVSNKILQVGSYVFNDQTIGARMFVDFVYRNLMMEIYDTQTNNTIYIHIKLERLVFTFHQLFVEIQLSALETREDGVYDDLIANKTIQNNILIQKKIDLFRKHFSIDDELIKGKSVYEVLSFMLRSYIKISNNLKLLLPASDYYLSHFDEHDQFDDIDHNKVISSVTTINTPCLII